MNHNIQDPYIITYNKVKFMFNNPRLDSILIDDIAHSLSHICRFTGHVPFHYSVAQHSLIVSRYVSEKNKMWALMHDAPECYVNDLATPVKQFVTGEYIRIHDRIMDKICSKFHIYPRREPEEVE